MPRKRRRIARALLTMVLLYLLALLVMFAGWLGQPTAASHEPERRWPA